MSGRAIAILTAALLAVSADAGAQQALPLHTLLGKVTDTNGRALPGVTVELVNPASAGSARTVTTNREGRYRIERVVPGLYVLSVKLAGFGPVIRDLEIGGGPEEFEYDVALKPMLADTKPVEAPPKLSRKVICGMTVITPPPGIDPGIQAPKAPPSATPGKPTIRAVQPTLCWEPSSDAAPAQPKR